MYFEPGRGPSGLRFNPFKSLCVPRPIGWISTVSPDGAHNIAPFSQFQNASYDPPMVMLAINRRPDGRLKDTVRNILDTGEFGWSMATYAQRHAVVGSGATFEPDTDEFDALAIAPSPARLIRPQLVADSPAHMECRLVHQIDLGGATTESRTHLLVGEVVAIHLNDDYLMPDGRFDILRARPLARMGYFDYTSVDSLFNFEKAGEDRTHEIEFMRERPAR